MSKLVEALRAKYGTPQAAIRALGLDEALLSGSSRERQMTKPSKFAATALQLIAPAIKPLLARDASVNLVPIFKGVTASNFNKRKIAMALDSALKGKLAEDAEGPQMKHVAQMLDHIEHMTDPEVGDEAVDPEEEKKMKEAAAGKNTLGMPEKDDEGEDDDPDSEKKEQFAEFLKSKGIDDDGVDEAMDMMFHKDVSKPAGQDEDEVGEEDDEDETEDEDVGLTGKEDTEHEDPAGEEDDDEAEDDEYQEKGMEKEESMVDRMKGGPGTYFGGAGDRRRGRAHDSRPITRHAMDEAMQTVARQVRRQELGIRRAIEMVRPYVGELSPTIAFDSAADVYRHAAVMLDVPNAKTIHPSALPTLIKLMPKAGAHPVEGRLSNGGMGMDEEVMDEFNKFYPDAARISNVV
jgi:DNA-directed RNA polymerase subunit delta